MFLECIHNPISVYIHAYLMIFSFIIEYSAMHVLPLGESCNSLTAVPEYLQLATHCNCTGSTDIICYRTLWLYVLYMQCVCCLTVQN